MNILSLFDGISCGQQALKELGVPVDKYYASEIDKYAISITQKNFPETIQLGDVTKWREWGGKSACCKKAVDVRRTADWCLYCGEPCEPYINWRQIDLIQGGSPCQGFSFAGKQLNFDDPRSKLFFEFVDILNHARKYNPDVKFLLENVRMKQEYQDVISEALGVKPVFIDSNIVSAQDRKRYYWTNIAEIQQPKNKEVLLEDIVEPDALVDRDKARAIIASIGRTTHREYFKKNQGQLVYSAIMLSNIYGGFKEVKPRVHLGKSVTIRTASGGGHIPSLIIEGNVKELTLEEIKRVTRKVTPLECERLQTLPDNYTAQGWYWSEGDNKETLSQVPISNTQRYKALGNGWTVAVIKHIYKHLI